MFVSSCIIYLEQKRGAHGHPTSTTQWYIRFQLILIFRFQVFPLASCEQGRTTTSNQRELQTTSRHRLGPNASSMSNNFWYHWPGLRSGFAFAVLQTLRLKPDGLMSMGPPCSSYVWINAATHGRTKERPFGFEQQYVDIGSMILI